MTEPQPARAPTDMDALLAPVPRWIVAQITSRNAHQLEEIVVDLGRPPRLRFLDEGRPITLSGEVAREDLQYVLGRVTRFREDNRTGIERTLHRITCIRDRYNEIVGFTFRAGRTIDGAARPLEDLLATGGSLLIVGKPGVGKTTLLRSAAVILADELYRRVVIADTSNEIGGDGQIPHPAIGSARRLQIPMSDPSRPTAPGDLQAKVILQSVINHGADTIVIDELGFESDARIARTIARRGVQFVATAHGYRLQDVIFNPDLAGLVGAPRSVTLSPDEIARCRATRHTILERTEPPVFQHAVEVARRDLFVVHTDVADSVDRILAGRPPNVEVRRNESGARTREQEFGRGGLNASSENAGVKAELAACRGTGSGEVV